MRHGAARGTSRDALLGGAQAEAGLVVNHANLLDAAMLAARRSAPCPGQALCPCAQSRSMSIKDQRREARALGTPCPCVLSSRPQKDTI